MENKICPFMSDPKNKVLCTPECALAESTHDYSTHALIRVDCSLGNYAEIVKAIRDQQS